MQSPDPRDAEAPRAVENTPSREGARLTSGAITLIASGSLLGAFILQNRDNVTLEFLFWSFTWPLWLFTMVVAVLGSLVWIGLGILRRHRRRVARRAARDS